ncbi:MAG TPA: hypothetical protein VNN21_05900, partial [Dehalococcoidia bacterium]|nr:hypothetical protein [Dehalococcoidia bacterium]
MEFEALLAAGEQALKRSDWTAARQAFARALELQETPAALEGLGTSCWWLDLQEEVLDARERAFRLYREQGNARGAARQATFLALDYVDYRGETAVASGWLQRAERLLSAIETSPEHGWLELYAGFIAVMFENDVAQARSRLERARRVAAALRILDIEMMSIALEGHVLIREGRVAAGMRCLDEAMAGALGGEMSDLAAVGNTCCSMIYACEAVADYDRATQWCARVREFCRRQGMHAFFTICRNYYATVLIWRGAWDEAESELAAAMQEFREQRQNAQRECLAKLGELRRRQGRLDEALELLARAEPHRLALASRAAIALDRGDAQEAIDLIERVIRRLGQEDQAEKAFALGLLVRAHLLTRDFDAAEAALAELRTVASAVGTQPLRATANEASATLAKAQGNLDVAKLEFQDAIDLYEVTGAAFDAARLRLEYALVLADLGRTSAALEQAIAAQTVFKRLGANHHARRAADAAHELAARLGEPPSGKELPYNLTP